MRRILAVMAVSAIGVCAISSAGIAGESWADQIIESSKIAEKQVLRNSVRVASLGATDVGDGETPSRTRRAKVTAPEDRPQTRRTRVASLSSSRSDARPEREDKPRRSLSGGSVNWTVDSGCLNGTLRGIVSSLASNFGPVTVNSTCRSRSRNASVGGAPKSYHLQGAAVDFRVHSNVSAVYASLRDNGSVGGLKHYGGGLFHIDTGPRRSW